MDSLDDSFEFQHGVMAEVDKQSQAFAGGFQVVVDLRAMFVRQRRDRFQLNDYLQMNISNLDVSDKSLRTRTLSQIASSEASSQ